MRLHLHLHVRVPWAPRAPLRQASIAIDAVLASGAGAAYMVGRGGMRGAALVCLAPLLSPAAAMALFCSLEERHLPTCKRID